MALVLGLTVAGFVVSRELAERSARHDSERRVELAAAQVRSRLDEATSLTESLRRFMLGEGVTGVTNNEFAKNALRWLFPVDLPAAAWVEEVPAEERRAYERRIDEPIVSPEERRKAAPPRPSYLPTTLVSGFPPMNTFGVDLKRESGIATALRRAIVPGGVGATPVSARKDGTSGLFLVAPAPNLIDGVLRPGAVVVFVSEATLRSAARNAPGLRITDGGILSSDRADGHTAREEFIVAGQQFAVDMPQESVSGPGRLLPWLILAAGLVLAPLAGALGVTAARRAKARADFETLAEEQAALRRVATLVAEGTPPTEVLDAVAVEVGRLIGADLAVLSRYDQGGGATILASRPDGTARELPFVAQPTIDPESLTAAVLRTGRPARIEDLAETPGPWAAQARELGYRSSVGAPVTVQGRLWGVMIVTSTKAHHWPPDTEDRLAAFTELLATAIANTESRGELAASEARARKLAEEQSALRRVATLVAQEVPPLQMFSAVSEEVGRVFGSHYSGVVRFEPDGSGAAILGVSEGIRSIPIGTGWPFDDFLPTSEVDRNPESLTAAVLRTGRPARVNDYAEASGPWAAEARELGYRSGVGVPVTVQGRLWGVMIVTSPEAHHWPRDTEDRLAAFTELLATAIANTESRGELATSEERARGLAEEQAALRRVATLVAREPASEAFFSTVAREVASVLGVPGALVERFESDGASVSVGAAYNSDLSGAERLLGVGARTQPDPGSLTAQVFETHRTARVDDFSTLRGAVGDAARGAGVGSGCAGPIVVDRNLWGMLAVFSRAGTVLPVGTENRLHEFIELVATAIANYEARADLAASEARARELADEQAALRRVATLVAEGASPDELFSAVTKEVAGVIDIPVVGFHRYEADGTFTILANAGETTSRWIGTRWPVGDERIEGVILATGRPARQDEFTSPPEPVKDPVLEDLRLSMRETRSVVGVPIVVEGSIWGFMSAATKPGAPPIPSGTEERLARFTELAATAVANSQARERVAQLADEQAALRRVATLVAEGATPSRVFDAVREEVARMFNIPSTILMRFDADGTGTLLATYGDYLGPVGTRWPLEGDTSAVAMVHQTGRAERADYTNIGNVRGPLAHAARRGGVRYPVAVPVVVEGALWGAMSAGSHGPAPPPADLEGRLAEFTELLGTAIANAESRGEVDASRARIVATADATRRRIERDLHDGIQQWLVALALRARKAAGLSEADEAASEELSGLADDLVAVTDELREISRGIHPAILSDAGLDDALEALARRSAVRVDLDVSFEGRYDPTLEATVYYVAAESITNAVKHARASTVMVRGGRRNGAIELEIRDDGIGGADPLRGTGLIGLQDRVDTLGGTISFASPAGAGTTIRVKLPAGQRDTPPSG